MVTPESTTFELEESRPRTAVLGIGSCEQHSAHLPIDTDHFIAQKASFEIARRLGALYLHPLPYSVSLEHRGFAGTTLLRPQTLKEVIWDIADSLGRWGVRFLALINFHGGNFILNPAAREWNLGERLPPIFLVEFASGLSDTGQNLHACEVETSLMLFLAPEQVRLDRRADFVPASHGREDLTHLGMKKLSPTGVWGFPSRASRSKGERWFNEGVEYAVQRVNALQAASE